MPRIVALRRASAGFVLLLWLNVATANVVACTLDVSFDARTAHATLSHPPAHAEQHNTTLSDRGACGAPQLLTVDYLVPPSLTAPAISVVTTRPFALAPGRLISLKPRLDPPPPRT
jgi:hypothetical protein